MTVSFYDSVDDSLIRFAVIAAKHDGKWVFCRHKERMTYEIPGGHREEGEAIADTANRELFEETGAKEYAITPVCVYSVIGSNRVNQTGGESFGMLYFADIQSFEKLPDSEMEEVLFLEDLPTDWTYPQIQPRLMYKVISALFAR